MRAFASALKSEMPQICNRREVEKCLPNFVSSSVFLAAGSRDVLVFPSPMSGIESMEFRVEVWDEADGHVEELVALCNNAGVGKAAYEAARKLRPGANLVLRHRSRVISRARG